jgi:hypothetical protein
VERFVKGRGVKSVEELLAEDRLVGSSVAVSGRLGRAHRERVVKTSADIKYLLENKRISPEPMTTKMARNKLKN